MLGTRPNYYDLLKTIAILLMVIDHIGYFFFPDMIVLRVIGRISMPLFLFLVGYNRSGRLRRDFIIAIIVVDGALYGYNRVMGYDITGSILRSILIIKLLHRAIKHYNITSHHIVRGGSLISLILLLYNNFLSSILDYGTLAMSIGLCGLMLGQSTHPKEKTVSFLTLLVVMLVYFIKQIEIFSLSLYIPVVALLAVIWTLLITGLSTIHHTYKGWRGKIILLLSKYSLRIYMAHVCLFACIAYLIQ